MKGQSSYQKGLRDIGDIRKTVDVDEWDPSTKIIKETTAEGVGYGVKFPYEGVEFYSTYQKIKDDPTVKVAGFFSPTDPLGLATSFYSLTGDMKKAEEKRIGSMAYFRKGQEAWKEGKGWEHFGGYMASSPIVQLGALPAIAMTGGVGYSAIAGKLAFKGITIGGKTIAAASILKAGAAIGGTALIIPPVYDIGSEWQRGRKGEAFAKSYMLGTSVAIGAKSFKMGQQLRTPSGLTFYEKSALKSFEKYIKKIPIDSIVSDAEGAYNTVVTPYAKTQWVKTSKALAEQIGFLRKQPSNVFDASYRVGEASTLQGKPMALDFLRKSGPYFKHGLIEKGSTVSPSAVVPLVHDIDYMAGAKAASTLQYFWRTRYPKSEKSWDIHQMIPVGEQTGSGPLGGVRMPDVVGPTGGQQISRVEWLDRLRVSSAELGHKGRMKDIERLPKVLTETYKELGFITEKPSGKVIYDFPSVKLEQAYHASMKGLEFMKKQPLMMQKKFYEYYKSPALSERFYSFKKDVYKSMPGLMERRIKKIIDPAGEKEFKKIVDGSKKSSETLIKQAKKQTIPDVFKESKKPVKTKSSDKSPYYSKTNVRSRSPIFKYYPSDTSSVTTSKSFLSPSKSFLSTLDSVKMSFPSMKTTPSPSPKTPSYIQTSSPSKTPSYIKASSSSYKSTTPRTHYSQYGGRLPSMFGRGRRGFDFGFKQQSFKFRKADIGTPFSDFKKIMKKVTL